MAEEHEASPLAYSYRCGHIILTPQDDYPGICRLRYVRSMADCKHSHKLKETRACKRIQEKRQKDSRNGLQG